MPSTETIDHLAQRVLGDELADAFKQIDLDEVEESEIELSIDELARRYLGSDTEGALDKIDLHSEKFGFRLEIEKLRTPLVELEGLKLAIGVHGMSLILAVLTVMAFLVGAEPAAEFLRILLSRL